MITHGIDSNDNVVPLLLAADGSVLVNGVSNSFLNPGRSITKYFNNNIAAGTVTTDVLTAGAGERYIVYGLAYRYTGTVATVTIRPLVRYASSDWTMGDYSGLTSNVSYWVLINIVIEDGDIFQVRILNATAGDTVNFVAFAGRIA